MEQKVFETKRQHYVPQTYLKRFSIKKGKEYYINSLSKNSTNIDEIKELNIKKTCLENNIYTLPFENTKDRMLLEHFFSNEIETHYSKIYSILLDDLKKTVTEEERALIITTVVTMFFRTSIWKSRINKFNEEIFERAYSMCKQYNKAYFYYNDVRVSIKGKTLEELQNEHKIKENIPFLLTQLNVMAHVSDIRIQKDDICIFNIDGDSEFITSDNPVIAFKDGIIIPINPENTMFLPIDNKHILCLFPNNNPIGRLSVFRNTITNNKKVEELNSMQKQSCERFVLGTKSSLYKSVN